MSTHPLPLRLAASLSLCITLLLTTVVLGAPNSFSPTGSMNVIRFGHTLTLLPNGKVLAAGGAATAPAELYDPATGQWTNTGSLKVPRYGHQAFVQPNGLVKIDGGTAFTG